MPNFKYNAVKKSGAYNWETDIVLAVLVQAGAANPDHAALDAALVATPEITATGYARVGVTGKTDVVSNANDNAVRNAPNVDFAAIAAGQNVATCILTKDGATDAARVPIYRISFGDGTITAVDTTTKTFTITGGDQTAAFAAGVKVQVTGSTGNNAVYTVASSAVNGANTNVVVSEAIASATADGLLQKVIPTDGNTFRVAFPATGIATHV